MARALVLLFSWIGLASHVVAEPTVDYTRQVKPLLNAKCVSCHGALRQEGGLRLDAMPGIRAGGESGPVIDMARPAESLLLKRVVDPEEESRMPPPGEGERLTDEALTLLRQWIEQGAVGPDEPVPADPREHWSYQPVAEVTVPRVARPDSHAAGALEDGINPVDALLASASSAPSAASPPRASRATLLRRVYLDLVGEPPSRDALRSFLSDERPDAYERVVDQLLASPAYGERWARHWMDVWRYSDWAGFGEEIRYGQRHIWQWRDWIVESLNEDQAYDRMVLEMLAADELAPGDAKALRATGFLARNWYKFDRNIMLDDTVEHTCRAFLGVTIRCARCHDHKYDPIGQDEYYRLRAVFEPYGVRTDVRPGENDANAHGLPRVYDAEPEATTFLFLRGDPNRAEKDRPLVPGTVKILGGELAVSKVDLPLASFYPALSPPYIEAWLQSLRQQRDEAEAGLAQAAEGSDEKARVLAQLRRDAAAARWDAAEARLTAERHKYREYEKEMQVAAAAVSVPVALVSPLDKTEGQVDPSADADRAQELQRTALVAERLWQRRDAEWQVAEQEATMERTRREMEGKPEAEVREKLGPLEEQLTAAKAKLQQAIEGQDKQDGSYEPLGEVYPRTSTGRRLALARWIANAQNPLTARVAVNHVWLRHFGAPLVASMDDFGLRTEKPANLQLLDYLASRWMRDGWRFKPLHRLLVTSAAYRCDSRAVEGDLASGLRGVPSGMQTQRMNAETVRDSILALSGSLDRTLGGPDLDHDQGLEIHRRSLYFRHSHEKQVLFLQLFDAANPRECYRREVSIRPQQALAMVNSSLTWEQARLLAARLAEGLDPAAGEEPFVRRAFESVLSRPPEPAEQQACLQFLERLTQQLSQPESLHRVGPAGARVLAADDPRQRARENLVLSLFSHHEFITIR
jgi:mono/diheme cytochrome c family protein